MENKIHYKKAKFYQAKYYCPYCKKELTYLWHGKQTFGLALDYWLYCSKDKIHFKKGIHGFREYELKLNRTSKVCKR